MKKYFSVRLTNSLNWGLFYWGTETVNLYGANGVFSYMRWQWMPMFVSNSIVETLDAAKQLKLSGVTIETEANKGLVAPEGWSEVSV